MMGVSVEVGVEVVSLEVGVEVEVEVGAGVGVQAGSGRARPLTVASHPSVSCANCAESSQPRSKAASGGSERGPSAGIGAPPAPATASGAAAAAAATWCRMWKLRSPGSCAVTRAFSSRNVPARSTRRREYATLGRH